MQNSIVDVTIAQIRAARALLGWNQAELGKRAQLSSNGVSLIEAGRVDPHISTLVELIKALEEAGIIFICDTNMRGVALRL